MAYLMEATHCGTTQVIQENSLWVTEFLSVDLSCSLSHTSVVILLQNGPVCNIKNKHLPSKPNFYVILDAS